jgi:hypothetical protein
MPSPDASFTSAHPQSRLPAIAIVFVVAALLHQYNGLIKGTLFGLGIQFDLAIFTAPVIAIAGLVLLVRGHISTMLSNPALVPLLAFAAWLTASLIWSGGYSVDAPDAVARVFGPAFSFPYYKCADFLTGCVVVFIVSALFAQLYPRVVLVHVVVACAFMTLLVPYVMTNTIVTNLVGETGVEVGIITNVDYIAFGTYFATLVVVGMAVAFRNMTRPLVIGLAALVAASAAYVVLASGSTQALLAPIIIATIMIVADGWRSWREANFMRLIVLVLLVAAGAALLFSDWSTDVLNEYDTFVGISRLLSKFDENIGFAETSGRGGLRDLAVSAFLDSPIVGVGLGGFSGTSYALVRDYPHHIIYEIMCELGLVGLGLFLWFAWKVWEAIRVVLLQGTVLGDAIVYICGLYFISALVSSALNDHRTLFLFLGYVAGTANAIRASNTWSLPAHVTAQADGELPGRTA